MEKEYVEVTQIVEIKDAEIVKDQEVCHSVPINPPISDNLTHIQAAFRNASQCGACIRADIYLNTNRSCDKCHHYPYCLSTVRRLSCESMKSGKKDFVPLKNENNEDSKTDVTSSEQGTSVDQTPKNEDENEVSNPPVPVIPVKRGRGRPRKNPIQ
jgi:hypothetical protein